jgi:hypothetical protein
LKKEIEILRTEVSGTKQKMVREASPEANWIAAIVHKPQPVQKKK